MHSLLQDFRFSLRQFLHNPGFAFTAVFSLALGIGATVAVFSAIYGILLHPFPVASYSVVQRTNELGIRVALGAPRTHIFRVVIASVAASVAIGVVAGLAASFGLGHFLASWVGVTSTHPLLITGISLLLLWVAALACIIPVRRALAIDPMIALRRE